MLLDVCEDVGQQHYKTYNNLQPLLANLGWGLEKITGIEGRPKLALDRFQKFFRSRVHLFIHPSDDNSIPPVNPESKAYKRMMDKLAKYERLGIDSDEVGWLKTDYAKWRKDNNLRREEQVGQRSGSPNRLKINPTVTSVEQKKENLRRKMLDPVSLRLAHGLLLFAEAKFTGYPWTTSGV